MDYSLLVGIHNVDQACREQAREEAVAGAGAGAGAVDQRRPQGQKSLYSTAIEAIQAEFGTMGSVDSEDRLVMFFMYVVNDAAFNMSSVQNEVDSTGFSLIQGLIAANGCSRVH